MAWKILIGMFAAFGFLSAHWILLGALLLGRDMETVICLHIREPEQARQLHRLRWLRDLGLLAGRILVVDCGLAPEDRQRLEEEFWECEFCGPEELSAGLELERKRFG